MITPSDLAVPVVAAPMAGGPSTPALAAAVTDAGGVGFLAAGNKTADALAAQIAETRTLTSGPFGVNLFVPELREDDAARREIKRVEAYRTALTDWADEYGVDLPLPHPDDDDWDAKLDLLEADPVPVVSFTFGLPPAEAVLRLHAVGTAVWASVTSVADAVVAASRGVNALVVQGTEAGGHRATAHCVDVANDASTIALVAAVRWVVDLPVIAAGGIMDAAGVHDAIMAGASAAQCGTAFLLTPEAGTSEVLRQALVNDEFTDTVVTRAFTGRLARSLANRWTAEFTDAPAFYPAVHQVTSPLRAAAAQAGDAQRVHLWAGTGWRQARTEPAADVVAHLAG
ncbi:MAG: nitronate monooxygenase [Propionibacteriaceae bacterium]|nr:nitronate monooxygenase [Propionibacteriaceae bacterium]